ncbi:hypothetical protein QJQ45_000301 [Haematococcus lacustris]|nr:hypothetical protein QJQ45_000301 [Haematococcus lacustris]
MDSSATIGKPTMKKPKETLVKVDINKPGNEQPTPLHNRWHPDIPPVGTAEVDQMYRIECIEWTGGQIKNNDSAEDMKAVDLRPCHHLSGPIRVVDKSGAPALPGDLLVVEISNIGALEGSEWGYCGIFDRENGGGFLTDHFPNACKASSGRQGTAGGKAVWDFEGIYCSSRHIPGVRFAGIIHPGLIGTAPSHELLEIWNKRETQLVEDGDKAITLGGILHSRPLALLPEPEGALLGSLTREHPDWERIAKSGSRTIPPRENGGNCDIKNLTRGSRVYFPVFVEGANLSMGDIHFSQGDGEEPVNNRLGGAHLPLVASAVGTSRGGTESGLVMRVVLQVSFCGAIEMNGFIDIKCDIIRGGMAKYLTPMGPTPLHVNPIFEIGPLEPHYSEWLVFEGISVDEQGKQHFLDASIAFKRAVLNCIDYLHKVAGYTKEQVYMLLSCCPCEGRISGIVDSPNACATLAIPTAIFDMVSVGFRDIRPQRDANGVPPPGVSVRARGDCPRATYTGSLPITVNMCMCGNGH